MLIALGLLGYMLLTSALSTLTSFAHFRIVRHNLVRESKRRRNEYLNSVLERVQKHSGVTVEDDDEIESSVEVLDDDDQPADTGPLAMPAPVADAPLKQAA